LILAALTNSSRGRRVIRAALELLGLYAAPARSRPSDEDLVARSGRYRDEWMDVWVRPDDGGLVLDVAWTDPFTGERIEFPPTRAEATAPGTFVVAAGDAEGDPIDFPRPGLGRFGGVVVPRTPD
jgi:hypothetical protein